MLSIMNRQAQTFRTAALATTCASRARRPPSRRAPAASCRAFSRRVETNPSLPRRKPLQAARSARRNHLPSEEGLLLDNFRNFPEGTPQPATDAASAPSPIAVSAEKILRRHASRSGRRRGELRGHVPRRFQRSRYRPRAFRESTSFAQSGAIVRFGERRGRTSARRMCAPQHVTDSHDPFSLSHGAEGRCRPRS